MIFIVPQAVFERYGVPMSLYSDRASRAFGAYEPHALRPGGQQAACRRHQRCGHRQPLPARACGRQAEHLAWAEVFGNLRLQGQGLEAKKRTVRNAA